MKKTLRIILIKILYKWVKFLSYVISKTLIYACGLGTNPPPQKGAFKDSAMQMYCSLWVVVFETCSDRTVLLPRRARLYHYNRCVVVVRSYLQLRLIRHEWGVSFFNVGASLKNYSRRLKEQSCASPLTLEWTNCLRAWNKILPHKHI